MVGYPGKSLVEIPEVDQGDPPTSVNSLVLPVKSQCLLLEYHCYPLVNVYIAIENGHRNSGFTDLPINSMVIFHSFFYVYQRVHMSTSTSVETTECAPGF